MTMNKSRMKRNHQNHSEIDSENEGNTAMGNLDLSLLRKPIATSVTGLEEVLRAYNDGTNELKKLLSKECDLIYECKVCRNIFRSLTNFISHKRVYCRSTFNASDHFHFRNNGFMVQDVSAIIQAEQNINKIIPGTEDMSKDLSGVVERILWKQHQSRSSNVRDVYEQINAAPSRASEVEQQKNDTLMLNPVNNSDVAVYQSLQTENENSNMKEEINEVHNLLEKSNTVIGADGKVMNLFSGSVPSGSDLSSSLPDKVDSSLTCQICNISFETEKTLKLHLEMKHLPSAYFYQCPSCTQKFSSSGAVLKHLSNDHKKSNRRIRLMRDNIIKKRVRADEISVVKTSNNTSRELQQLKISNGSEASTNKSTNLHEWSEVKIENDVIDNSYTCPSCLKKFDRKAVYTGHVQMCSDIKDREQEKMKKKKAKDGTKIRQQLVECSMESEDNSNISEKKFKNNDEVENKRRRKKKIKDIKINLEERKIEMSEENTEDIIDWNLDDEEESKKLDNIKKEIIEDEYKRNLEANSFLNSVKQEINNDEGSSQELNDDDENDDSELIIDEKAETGDEFKCPTCNKVFGTNEKLKYHLTFYHSRQKRFKCKMCEYQGYRKKDTMNHINFVHNENVTLETLNNYTETVSKAVNEEDVKIQNELKKNQLKIKRKLARERQRKKAAEAKLEAMKSENERKTDESVEDKFNISTTSENDLSAITPIKSSSRRKSIHVTIEHPSEELKEDDDEKLNYENAEFEEVVDDDINDDDADNDDNDDNFNDAVPLQQFHREPTIRSCKSPSVSSISRYGKVIKNLPTMEGLDSKDSGHNSRPIRNRIKPVRKDFLYDLSDLLKKEADAYREQVFQSSNVTVKRELRKRAMSTHTREIPSLNTFDHPSMKKSTLESFMMPLPSPIPPNNIEESPSKKDQRNRRMSVFVPPTRSMFPPQPRSPPYRPPATHKNAGSAYKMALKEFDNNRASLYDPKFLWTICFEQESEKIPPKNSLSSNVSAAASILQRLSSKNISADSKSNMSNESPLTAEQLCKKFELINVTNINDLDIPVTNTINLNPGRAENNLISLSLDEEDNDVCVLQESDDDSDGVSEPKLDLESGCRKNLSTNRKRNKRAINKKQSEKRKSTTNGQRRLTVMQRLQENKIRKSREQLFQRLIHQQNDNVDSHSSDFDLFQNN